MPATFNPEWGYAIVAALVVVPFLFSALKGR